MPFGIPEDTPPPGADGGGGGTTFGGGSVASSAANSGAIPGSNALGGMLRRPQVFRTFKGLGDNIPVLSRDRGLPINKGGFNPTPGTGTPPPPPPGTPAGDAYYGNTGWIRGVTPEGEALGGRYNRLSPPVAGGRGGGNTPPGGGGSGPGNGPGTGPGGGPSGGPGNGPSGGPSGNGSGWEEFPGGTVVGRYGRNGPPIVSHGGTWNPGSMPGWVPNTNGGGIHPEGERSGNGRNTGRGGAQQRPPGGGGSNGPPSGGGNNPGSGPGTNGNPPGPGGDGPIVGGQGQSGGMPPVQGGGYNPDGTIFGVPDRGGQEPIRFGRNNPPRGGGNGSYGPGGGFTGWAGAGPGLGGDMTQGYGNELYSPQRRYKPGFAAGGFVPGVTPGAPQPIDTVDAKLAPNEMVMNTGVTKNPTIAAILTLLNILGAEQVDANGPAPGMGHEAMEDGGEDSCPECGQPGYGFGGWVKEHWKGLALAAAHPGLMAAGKFAAPIAQEYINGKVNPPPTDSSAYMQPYPQMQQGYAMGGKVGDCCGTCGKPKHGYAFGGFTPMRPQQQNNAFGGGGGFKAAAPAGASPFAATPPAAAPPSTPASQQDVWHSPWYSNVGGNRDLGGARDAGYFDPRGNQMLINSQNEAARGTADALVRRQMSQADLGGLDPAQRAIAKQQALRETGRGVQDIMAQTRAGALASQDEFYKGLYGQEQSAEQARLAAIRQQKGQEELIRLTGIENRRTKKSKGKG